MSSNGKGAWQEPRLTLDGFEPDRPCVKLFGKLYLLLDPMDLSLVAEAKFNRLQHDFNRMQARELEAQADLGDEYVMPDERAQELSDKLGAVVQMIVLDLPDDVLAQISDRWRMRILQVFGEARVPMEQQTTPFAGPLAPLRPTKSDRMRGPNDRSSPPASSDVPSRASAATASLEQARQTGASLSPGSAPSTQRTPGRTG